MVARTGGTAVRQGARPLIDNRVGSVAKEWGKALNELGGAPGGDGVAVARLNYDFVLQSRSM